MQLNEADGFQLLDPQLSFQVKTTTSVSSESDTDFGHEIDAATYDSLRIQPLANPRFLVVVRLPKPPVLAIDQDIEKTVLRHAPFFRSLKGEPALAPGQKNKVIRISKSALLTPTALRDLLFARGRGQL
jgi:hypothetical protein